MSSIVYFTKMSGAGNDFVVIDNRSRYLPEPLDDLVRGMCERKRGVGADGLIAVEVPMGTEDFSMRYFNSDGSEADLCGNGARCVAVFAKAKGIASAEMTFSSQAGLHAAAAHENAAKVSMPDPAAGPREIQVPFGEEGRGAIYLIVGVPHVILFEDDLTELDITSHGSRIRHDPSLGPEGANVNFVNVVNRNRIQVRTYERGVEAETLACGTGSVASAVAACSEEAVSMPVEIETAGGDLLVVYGELGEGGFGRLELEGPALQVYEGQWPLP